MFFTFIIVVILTAVVLVAAAMAIAKLLAPRAIRRKESRTNVVFPLAENHGYSSVQVTTCSPSCS